MPNLTSIKPKQQLKTSGLSRTDREFLPGALLVQDQPPHPMSHWTTFAILVLILTALLWAFIGELDIVAKAQGKLVPRGQVKAIQPLETAKISEIFVSEGVQVNTGDPLVKLDDLRVRSERNQIRIDLARLQQEIERVQSLAQAVQSGTGPKLSILPLVFNESLISIESRLIDEEIITYQEARKQLRYQIAEQTQRTKILQTEINALEQAMPILVSRVNALANLARLKLAAKVDYLELKQRLIVSEQSLAAKRLEIGLSLNIERRLESELVRMRSEIIANLLNEFSRLKAEHTKMQASHVSLSERLEHFLIRSPINGRVKDLQINTIDGVVTTAQELMKIVPTDYNLVAETWVQNKDIGFIYQGQAAEVKLDAFPFTKYGIINATVTGLSADANQVDQQQLLFKAEISLDKSAMAVDNRTVELLPGMSVSAEIKTGKRRIIDYVLDPLLRYKDESIKER